MKHRTELLNYISKQIGAKNYLEIGVQSGLNYDNIIVENKVSVDPNEDRATFKVTSDEYFEMIKDSNVKFDVVFVDGLHHSEQVKKDIENSLLHLSDGGIIVCHDMLPQSYEAQLVPRVQAIWNGDCWKAFVQLRRERKDLTMFTLAMDNGCGIICRGSQNLLVSKKEITYDTFCENRDKWMVVKSPDFIYDFFKYYY